MGSSLPRAVIDTSVLVAGVLGAKGASRELLTRALDLEFVWLVSDPILKEYRMILAMDKIKLKATFSKKLLKVLDRLWEELKKGVVSHIKVVRDPTDDMFVECAVDHHGDFIVSLDQDLLELIRFGSVDIIRPSDFLSILRKG